MIKKMLLYFLCLSLFLSIPGCKKKLPTTPDIPTIILPTIEYFNASPESIMLDSSSTLSWSTTNATTVTIDQGIGGVSATGTKEVSPSETTTYTLTAKNSDGQKSQSCVLEIKKWAILNFSTDPESPVIDYNWLYGTTTSDFTVILTETNGIGGQIDSLLIKGLLDISTVCSAQEFGGGVFNSLGSLSRYCSLVIPCKVYIIIFYITGVDNNGYVIDEEIWWDISWTQNKGLMRFLKIVEGQNHHKLIK